MPDVSGGDLLVTGIVGSTVSGTSALWATQYAVYNAQWTAFGKLVISGIANANAGQFAIDAITPTGFSWTNASGFANASLYNWSLQQASAQNAPIVSDLNGVTTKDISGHSATNGTAYTYRAGDAFFSSICKISINMVDNLPANQRKAAAFLCYVLPAWVDFCFATNQFFQLGSSNNDSARASSLLNGETRIA